MTSTWQVCRYCGETIARGQSDTWRTRALVAFCPNGPTHEHVPQTRRSTGGRP